MSVVVAALVAGAVLVGTAPSTRRLPRGGREGAVGRSAGVRDRARGWVARGRHRDERPADLAALLHAVVAQLRVGVPPAAAWGRALDVPHDGPVELATLEQTLADRVAGPGRAGRVPDMRVRAVVAGAHVAADTGAPLADVLEDLADAVAADAEQAGELAAALAGPRATARVLVWLPVLGLLVGAVMGARPWEVLLDGGVGTCLGLVGVVLVGSGRAWVAALLRRAAAP